MTRAGDKLYADPAPRRGLFASREFWRRARDMLLLLTVVAAALFGFG